MHMVCEALGGVRDDNTVLASHLEGWDLPSIKMGFLGKMSSVLDV